MERSQSCICKSRLCTAKGSRARTFRRQDSNYGFAKTETWLYLKLGYIIVNPKNVKGIENFASTIKGAFKYGQNVNAEEIPKPDLIVEGSVAVDKYGHRLGKGGGYGDTEIKLLKRRFGGVPIVTTVHDMQIVDTVPFEEKDEKVSIIVTPTKVLRVSSQN